MANKTKTGKIFLPSITTAALFEHELLGQFSNGKWENSTPHDHWKPWGSLEVVVDVGCTPRVVGGSGFRKKNYNLRALLDLGKEEPACRYAVRDRMVAIAQMTLAFAFLGIDPIHDARCASEHMPANLAEWTERKASGRWDEDYIACYMTSVTPELAAAFYEHEGAYGIKELRVDLDLIKAAISTVDCY